jgi:cell division protein FtsW
MRKFLQNLKGDRVIWAVVFLLSVFSVLAVYSSTGTLAYRNKAGNTEYYLIKHLFILVMGLVLMYLAHQIRYTLYAKFSFIAIFAAVCLLGYTLFFGSNINEANRWLTLPVININFQTSDFAKLALIIYLAKLISNRQEKIKDFKSGFRPIIAPVIIICLLIMPANFSTAAILFATCLILMFVGRVSTKYILYLLGIMVLSSGILIVVLMNSTKKGRIGTWSNRIETFFGDKKDQNPDEVYQINQSKIAVATGGIFGKFPGNSTQRNMLPQAYSDFIYAIIIEEYGIIGGIVVIFLYLFLLYRGIRIATRCDKTFGVLLGLGISYILVFQAMINMAIVVGIFPVTGQPLPLVSMGGTSIWFTSIGIGIMLSISRANDENEKQKLEEATIKSDNDVTA